MVEDLSFKPRLRSQTCNCGKARCDSTLEQGTINAVHDEVREIRVVFTKLALQLGRERVVDLVP